MTERVDEMGWNVGIVSITSISVETIDPNSENGLIFLLTIEKWPLRLYVNLNISTLTSP